VFAVDARSYGAPWDGLSLAVGAGYMVAAALRLARYASSRDGGGHTLVGLPSPPAAMAAMAVIVLHPPAPVALAAFLALAALMIAGFPFPTITGLVVPFMAFWWTFAAGAAVGLVSPRVVAIFTLAVITSALVLLPGRRVLRRL
jgi:phosphatidylserine synthase